MWSDIQTCVFGNLWLHFQTQVKGIFFLTCSLPILENINSPFIFVLRTFRLWTFKQRNSLFATLRWLNPERPSVATSSISQNCEWGRQCKLWILLIKKLKLRKNTTSYITLTNNYAQVILQENKNRLFTWSSCFCVHC